VLAAGAAAVLASGLLACRPHDRRGVVDRVTDGRYTDEPVLRLDEVTKIYAGGSPVVALDKASFTIRRGELVAIVGPWVRRASGVQHLARVVSAIASLEYTRYWPHHDHLGSSSRLLG
jgi:ABC-type glutathione transport system ATPase component